MNRQNVDGVDGRESPALASSPHHSPRPRVARRGGAHAPPQGRACGARQHTRLRRCVRSRVLSSGLLEPKWFERRSGSLKPRATNTHCAYRLERPPRFVRPTETNTLGHSTGGMPWNREMLRQDQTSSRSGST
jgi:hypothetical protein